MQKFVYNVCDYEHEGDLRAAESYIKKICPDAVITKSYAERDYEAEFDYEECYGELDEHIYKGFVEFDAPKSCERTLCEQADIYIRNY